MKRSEPAKARKWRESLGLDQAQLGERIGYSEKSVYWMERGQTPPRTYANRSAGKDASRAIDAKVWLRYKMACAGLHAEIGANSKFEW